MRERFKSRLLALVVALTGIVATMPYIARQLVGMQVAIGGLGFPAGGLAGHLPLIIAFIVLAAFTYTSGLRAPALIAVAKDTLIFATTFAAIVVIPAKLGGYSAIFATVPQDKLVLATPGENTLGLHSAYATLALGSALALFLYPHAMTAILSASSGDVVKRNSALLAAYSFILGLIALLGYMAIAAGVGKDPAYASGFAQYGRELRGAGAVPLVISLMVCRCGLRGDRYRRAGARRRHVDRLCQPVHSQSLQGIHPPRLHGGRRGPHGQDHVAGGEDRRADVHPRHPARLRHRVPVARRHLDHPAAAADCAWPIHASLQSDRAAGWVAGTVSGTYMAAAQGFTSSVYPLAIFGVTVPGYAALYSVAINFLVAALLTPLCDLAVRRGAASGRDRSFAAVNAALDRGGISR